ncbi:MULTISPECIES: hypothetical protein [Burkholderia cepacia complex]|nr:MULTISPECIES: hypothetical protein [Burkholderia cepacia complex]MCA8082062.1 hypothetical protein [Burkholderia cepacia]MEB2603459.1 hypothetical protein [Burkholderia cenocepacia]
MNVTAWQFKESGWGRGVAAGVALIALVHPLAAIAAANLPFVAAYLIMRS